LLAFILSVILLWMHKVWLHQLCLIIHLSLHTKYAETDWFERSGYIWPMQCCVLWWPLTWCGLHQNNDTQYCAVLCLQCFDTVAWARQEEHPTCKKTEWCSGVVVTCLELCADCLHTVQLMPLHPKTLSSFASFKSRLGLPFWYWLSQAVLKNRALNGCSTVQYLLNRLTSVLL